MHLKRHKADMLNCHLIFVTRWLYEESKQISYLAAITMKCVGNIIFLNNDEQQGL